MSDRDIRDRLVEPDPNAEHFRDTWPAFQRTDSDPHWLDTDLVRQGWPKPTIYREHETIHVLANTIDLLRQEIADLKGGPDA